jgi:hypothetical protein
VSRKVAVGSPVSSSKRWRRVGVAGQVDPLEVGALVELVGDALEALLVGDEHLGAGVLEAVEDLLGLPPAVEADEDRPAGDRAPEGQAPLRVVLGEHRHPVAVADARPVPQGVPHPVGRVDEPLEAPLVVAVDEERLLAPQRRQLGHRPQAGQPLLVHLHLDPVDGLGGGLEHASRTGELFADLGGRRHGVPPGVLLAWSGQSGRRRGSVGMLRRACEPRDRCLP